MLKQILHLWDLHFAGLAAALAFYAVLSVAPFMALVAGASAMLFGEKITKQDTVHELQEIIGPEVSLCAGKTNRVDCKISSWRFGIDTRARSRLPKILGSSYR